MIQSNQGGQTPYGLYFGSGDFHDMVVPHSTSFPMTTNVVRPSNQFDTHTNVRSSYRLETTLTMNDYYPSPSFRLASSSNPCQRLIEIGNYVWEDTDGDGEQDAGEPGLEGIRMELYDAAGNLLAIDSTNSLGYYFFSGNNIDDAEWQTADDTLQANTSYYIVAGGNGQFASNELTLNGTTYQLTSDSTNSGTNRYAIDSDGTIAVSIDADFDGEPYVQITTGNAGEVDHTFDFGFYISTCSSIDSLITDRTICSSELVDTLAVTTTFSNPDSIAFVYFTSEQTDSSVIYSSGIGIDAVQISSGNDTVRIFNVSGFINSGTTPDTFYVYAITRPIPPDNTCRPYDEILVIVNPQPSILGRDTSICDGQIVDLSTLITGTALGGLEYGTAFGTYGVSNPVTPSSTTTYFVRDSVDVTGCLDTTAIIVTILDTVQTPISQDICNGNSFTFNSQSLSTAGTYRDTMTASNGCDSFIVLTLNVLDTVQTPISQDICNGNSFTFNSQSLTSAGTYRDTMTASNGCDSFIVLTLNVLDTVQTPISQDICNGNSFTFNSQSLTTAGTYRDTMTASNGCDSFIVLTLNVLDTVQTPISQDICNGNSFTFNSQSLTTAGTYRDTMTASNGCDSFIVLTLNVLDTVQTPISQDICNGNSFTFNSQNLTTAGTYRDTMTASNGCDSFIVLTLNVLDTVQTPISQDVCNGDSFTFNSQNLTLAGTYRDTMTASNGCDSFIVLTLNVNPNPSITGIDTAFCGTQTINLASLINGTISGGLSYGSVFGTYLDTITTDFLVSATTTFYVRDSNESTMCVDTAAIVVTVQNCDWGDLPDTSATTNVSDYQTLSANNGPVHVIISGLNLGTSVDDELDGQPSTDALGDGTDENGVTIFSSLDIYPGSTFRLPLNYENTTGSLAHIEAWIDWNGDGDFDDTDEMIFDVSDIGDSAYDRITITSPTNAVSGQFLGFRVRISNQDNMTPYGLISEGEIEDYLIGLDCSTQICVPITIEIKRE